ncbi:uncharacterized protein LOC110234547 [Exaiptasia diaphana]|uniref:Uncharacterized protein n=1 Tax=Exaiptasia diaphana TaxID=2652724 RepID=A0A913WXH3_EXADI|nr:uncharacterized protein LOC110234547 [Exaiptasia diaphana]KXJ17116.1 hypothetical protein AC249_AIPGENE8106 [Exaiptasia diaphana]
MENFEHDANDHLFEKELIRMCIEQLLDEDDERETSTDEVYSQKAKNHHFNSPNYQVIGQKPPRDSHHGKTNSYATVLSGNFKSNLGTSKLNPNAKVFIPQSYAVRTSS